jgi:hypothetical protein
MVGFGMIVSRMQLVELGLFAAAYLGWASWGWRRSCARNQRPKRPAS